LRKKGGNQKKNVAPRRPTIDTTASYDKRKRYKKKQIIQHSKKQRASGGSS
jgi:hypothetical protein